MRRFLPLFVIALMGLSPALAQAKNSATSELRAKSLGLQAQQKKLDDLKAQRKIALRQLPLLKSQVKEAQAMAARAELSYQEMETLAAVSRGKLDKVTLRYIESVQGLGYSRAMMEGQTPELNELAGTASAQDAVLIYSQGQMMVNRLQGQLEVLRGLASQAADRKARASAAKASAASTREQAAAALERQKQLTDILDQTQTITAKSMLSKQREFAAIFNRLLGSDPSLPGIDISAIGLPVEQRIVLLALREWKLGVQEEPMGSNDSAGIARYRSATAGAIRGGAWCAYFVSYIVRRAGRPIGANGSGTGLVNSIADWGRSTDRFFAADDKRYRAQPGDIVIWPSHTGIVISRKGNTMVTVEGNASDRVSHLDRDVSSAVGFVRVAGDSLTRAKQNGNSGAGAPSGSTL